VSTIISQSNPLGELMLVQGQGATQVFCLSGDSGEGLRETYCKVNLGK
jgi:hypothetical protein